MKPNFREKNDYHTKIIRDYVMGAVWIFVATIILWGDKLYRIPNNTNKNENYYILFGYICLVYGIWRIVKATTKKFYN